MALAVLGKAMTSRRLLRTGEQHDDAVEAQRDAAVGRGAVFERVKKEAKSGAGLFVSDAEGLEDLLLHVFAMDSDGAGA